MLLGMTVIIFFGTLFNTNKVIFFVPVCLNIHRSRKEIRETRSSYGVIKNSHYIPIIGKIIILLIIAQAVRFIYGVVHTSTRQFCCSRIVRRIFRIRNGLCLIGNIFRSVVIGRNIH